MAYDKKKIFEQAKQVIVKNKLYFIEDIVAYLPITKPTFYDYFKVDSDEFNELKELLETNKVELKVSMRSKWYNSDNPTLQMGLMKLLSTNEELKKLSMNHNEHTTNGKDMTSFVIELTTDNETNSETNPSI
jgi:hypothetical protein